MTATRNVARALVFLLAVLLTLPAVAGEGRDQLDRFYDRVDTMRADFEQVLHDAEGEIQRESRGDLVIARPGRFRFEYTTPYRQLYVADGGRVWSYDPDLEQVIVKTLDETVGDTPAMLLAGGRPLASSFDIVEIGAGGDMHWVELTPLAPEHTFETIRIGFRVETGRIGVMELLDGLGQTTRMHFENVEYNPEVTAGIFDFEPPVGVDVIGADDLGR